MSGLQKPLDHSVNKQLKCHLIKTTCEADNWIRSELFVNMHWMVCLQTSALADQKLITELFIDPFTILPAASESSSPYNIKFVKTNKFKIMLKEALHFLGIGFAYFFLTIFWAINYPWSWICHHLSFSF